MSAGRWEHVSWDTDVLVDADGKIVGRVHRCFGGMGLHRAEGIGEYIDLASAKRAVERQSGFSPPSGSDALKGQRGDV